MEPCRQACSMCCRVSILIETHYEHRATAGQYVQQHCCSYRLLYRLGDLTTDRWVILLDIKKWGVDWVHLVLGRDGRTWERTAGLSRTRVCWYPGGNVPHRAKTSWYTRHVWLDSLLQTP